MDADRFTKGEGAPLTWERWLAALSMAAFLFALLGACVQHYRLRGLKFDDAWIHLRYARNLAEGKGFVFNEGEKVLGSAGVLWNLVLAAPARLLGGDTLPSAVSVLNFLLLLGAATFVLLALLPPAPKWFAFSAAALLVVQGPLLVSSIGGMETTLFFLLHAVVFWALTRRRFALAGVCAGASICVRVEGLPAMLAVLVSVWLCRRDALRRAVVGLACVPALLLGWCWVYFGSPLAQSTLAKRLVYTPPPWDALRACTEALLQALPFHRLYPFGAQTSGAAALLGLLVWACALTLGFLFLRRERKEAAPLVIQALAPPLFYAFANPLMFPWYFCTFVPHATLIALLGMLELGRRIPGLRPRLRPALALTLLVSFSIEPVRDFWRTAAAPDTPEFSFQSPNARESARTYQYAAVARRLNERAAPSDRVCIPEIGAFGYFYRGRILDPVGLVSPEALRYQPLPREMRRDQMCGAIPPALVRDFGPEFVVSLDYFADALFADPWFLRNYEEIGRWDWFAGPARWRDLPERMWGGSEVRAYRRRF